MIHEWACSGAYDKDAFANVLALFDKAGTPVGFLLTWGYQNDRQFTEFFPSQDAAMKSGYEWVLGCDYLDAPDAIKAMYLGKDEYIAGQIL